MPGGALWVIGRRLRMGGVSSSVEPVGMERFWLEEVILDMINENEGVYRA